MLFKRSNFFPVAVGLLVLLLGTPSFAQGPQGLQIFAAADESTFGGQPRPNEGYFLQFDVLYWGVTAPSVHPIGFGTQGQVVYTGVTNINGGTYDDSRSQVNTLNTSPFDTKFSVGDRFEFGRIEDANGWMVTILQLRNQEQDFSAASATMNFDDPAQGQDAKNQQLIGNVNTNTGQPEVIEKLPVLFYNVQVSMADSLWGVEANYVHRFMTCHDGGTFEMLLGGRYLEFNERFNFASGDNPADVAVNTPASSYLAESSWETDADNHIIGPEIGLRYFKKQGRWMFNTEGRFVPGINCQNFRQNVNMGPELSPNPSPSGTGSVSPPFQPLALPPTQTTNSAFASEFSPIIEMRLEARYQITQAISFHAGWTGMFVDNIARASSVTFYQIPGLGIDTTQNRETLFVNGVTLGFDINR